MTDTPPNSTTMMVEPPKRSFLSRISLVWLIPLISLAGALYFAYTAYRDQDVPIVIEFSEANGIKAHSTVIKFRDVDVGHVEEVTFSEDLSTVLVHAAIDPEMAHFLDADTEFWVVSAEVSAQGISGLDTVLSGAYIAASWDSTPGTAKREFVGLDDAPLVANNKPGTRITLRSQNTGSVSVGAPLLLRGIGVGKVESVKLSDAGDSVLFSAFVDAPYDDFITTGTRFWNASGINVSLGSGGLNLNVDSLTSIVQGGIVFDTLFSGGDPLGSTPVFDLYRNEEEARNSLFDDSLDSLVYLSSEFEGNLRGLKVGAEVSYNGLKVGEVTEMSARVHTDDNGEESVRLVANFAVQPNRLGLNPDEENDTTLAFLNELVKRGLRAQISSQGLLASSLFIALVEAPEAEPAQINLFATPYPSFPTIPAAPDTLASAAEGVLERVGNLPIEELLDEAIQTLASIRTVAGDPRIREIPGSVADVLQGVEGIVTNEKLQSIPDDLSGAIADLRSILDQVEESSAIASLTSVLGSADVAAKQVAEASETLPGLVQEIEVLVQNINALPLGDIAASASELLASADQIVSSEALQAMPEDLAASVAEVRRLLEELEGGQAIAKLTAVLDNANVAAANVATASSEFPELLDNINTVVATLGELPMGEVVTSANDMIQSIDSFMRADGMQAMPAELTGTLTELRGILADVQEGGAVANLNAALADVSTAAANVSSASEGLPQLMEDIDALVQKAESLPLEDLAASANDVLQSADTLIASEGMQALPASLSAALDQVRAVLDELQQGGAVENLNRTLASAENAADEVAKAAQSLPELVERLDRLASTAEATLAAYGGGSPINREAVLAVRAVRQAAEDASSLAKTIQRKPNALLTGR
ncbi:MlaD family protein [Pseudoruegeria sp. SHC-113]|uniref:MlaD family protein n=1 Tax=Pseudoruegeria sp. SHC-113 TaxID=2855439 RepID=UPI0021BAC1F6|nr:MlaD family protein [Pseudoruegeria sp. SHC-113]MCT8161404.1 MCE family protein [Pseudoruegeria sp. SHC-113]